jgi:hypothetical protein
MREIKKIFEKFLNDFLGWKPAYQPVKIYAKRIDERRRWV